MSESISPRRSALYGVLCASLLLSACDATTSGNNDDVLDGFSIPLIDVGPGEAGARGDGAMSDAMNVSDTGSASDVTVDGSARDLSDGGRPVDSTADTVSVDSTVDTTVITYSWLVGGWSTCSAVCNGGTQTRTVQCVDSLGTAVAELNCTEARPADTQSCNSAACSWVTGTWSTCSRDCDGGTQTRSVSCKTASGTTVADSNCTTTRPTDSRNCNTQPCCTTDALTASRSCTGTAQGQWFPYGSNTGSSADRASCASQCTSYAKGQGFSSWCCEFYEDSGSGTTWVCRAYTPNTIGGTGKANYYAAQGRCDSP